MPIYVSDPGSGDFEPAPEGVFPAVCVDVVDKGLVKGQWGESHKVQIRWQLDGHSDAGLRDDGKQWLVVRQFTATLHEKGALRKFLRAWRGKEFTAEELAKFDIEKVLGAPCLLQIIRTTRPDGKVFADVDNVLPLPKGFAKPVAAEYVRMIDRGPADGIPAGHDDDDVPDW